MSEAFASLTALAKLSWDAGEEGKARAAAICAALASDGETGRRGFMSPPLGALGDGLGQEGRFGATERFKLASFGALDFAALRDDAACFEACLDLLPAQAWGASNLGAAAWLMCHRGAFACMDSLAARPEALRLLPAIASDPDWRAELTSPWLLSSPAGAAHAKRLASACHALRGPSWLYGAKGKESRWAEPACSFAWFGGDEPDLLGEWARARDTRREPDDQIAWARRCAAAARELGVESSMLRPDEKIVGGRVAFLACAVALESSDPLAARPARWWAEVFEEGAADSSDPALSMVLPLARSRVARMEIEPSVPMASKPSAAPLRM